MNIWQFSERSSGSVYIISISVTKRLIKYRLATALINFLLVHESFMSLEQFWIFFCSDLIEQDSAFKQRHLADQEW